MKLQRNFEAVSKLCMRLKQEKSEQLGAASGFQNRIYVLTEENKTQNIR